VAPPDRLTKGPRVKPAPEYLKRDRNDPAAQARAHRPRIPCSRELPEHFRRPIYLPRWRWTITSPMASSRFSGIGDARLSTARFENTEVIRILIAIAQEAWFGSRSRSVEARDVERKP